MENENALLEEGLKLANEQESFDIYDQLQAEEEELHASLFAEIEPENEPISESTNTETSANTSTRDSESEDTEEDRNGTGATDNGGISGFLSPDLIIPVADVVLSRLFTILTVRFTPLKCEVKDFKLDAQERAALKRPVKRYLESLEIQEQSPLTELLICVGMIYGGKLAMLTPKNKEAVENAKPEKKSSAKTGSNYVPKYLRGSDGKVLKDEKGEKVLNPEYN